MAVTLQVPVKCVGLTDGGGGYVEYEPHSHTHDGAVNRIMVILGGLIESADTADDLPAWPLDPEAGPYEERADRRLLATLAKRLELTERQYDRIEGHALTLASHPTYRQMVTAITGTLDFTPIIDRDCLARVVAIAERRA